MRRGAPSRRALLLAGLSLSGCDRGAPSTKPDSSRAFELAVRVPAALSVARAIDTLSVAIDPASLGLLLVEADPGMVFGVETSVSVFPQGQSEPVAERHAVTPGVDFDAQIGSTWSTTRDGVPAPGTKYVVAMRLALFETDARPTGASRDWDPHAGRFKSLWMRELRQAEE